jgi:hypothetical protein
LRYSRAIGAFNQSIARNSSGKSRVEDNNLRAFSRHDKMIKIARKTFSKARGGQLVKKSASNSLLLTVRRTSLRPNQATTPTRPVCFFCLKIAIRRAPQPVPVVLNVALSVR